MATAREVRRWLAFGLLALILALGVGCGGGGSEAVANGGGSNNGGSGGNNPPPPPPPPPPDDDGPPEVEGPSATIRWSAAAGPVAGYRVFVSRNAGNFQLEITTPAPQADVKGEPGDLVRVRVAAFDTFNNSGPLSPPSDPFEFVAAAPGSSSGSDPSSDPGSDPGTPPSGGGSGSGEVAGGGTGGGTPPASTPDDDDEPSAPARRGDLSGDGKADLAWQSADGTLVRVTSADLSQVRVYSLPSGSWRLVAIGDFDADTLPDLLFSSSSELAFARGSALRAAPGELTLEPWSALAADASFAASGDFDGDGAADALVVSASGSSIVLTGGGVWPMPALAADAVAGAGDANGDGHDDLFLYGPSGLLLWRMTTSGLLSSGSVPAPDGVAVEGVGDFDSNGAAEVALRTAPDALAMQRAETPFESWAEPVPSGAALVGCADYDGDGATDRLWQDAESLHIVGASGDQPVALDPASPWRLLRGCR